MKAVLQKAGAFIISAILLYSILPVRAAANFEIPGTCQVQTDTGVTCIVKTLDYDYDFNTYFSLRDMAMALKDTDKSFSLEITQSAVSLNTGNAMMAADLAMILDVNISVPAAGSLQVHTQDSFRISPDVLEQAGYFYGVNSVLVGDATTGEIYYRYQSDAPCPIASTSKLMTCLLVMDAISAGQINPEKIVTVSEAASRLAASGDGVIPLEAGAQITVEELLLGALLPSSNECALCLAEAVAGSEEAFVQMMNQKAQELGLSQAMFYNSHGLPSYTKDPIPSKRQNRMSAEDMFRLVSYLLKVYPQITDITSLESAALQSLDLEVRNTNPLLRNMPEVTGLKTGTTNKAGACLVTTLAADDGTAEHDLAVIVLGTEDSIERGRVSGLLARYALDVFYTGTEATGAGTQIFGELPTHAEAAVDRILRTAKKH